MPLTSAEACEEKSQWLKFGKKSCASTDVRKPGNTCASPASLNLGQSQNGVLGKELTNTIVFLSLWLLSHITIVETTDCGERGMNPVAMTIINPQKEYWPSSGDRTSDLLFSSPVRLSYGVDCCTKH